MQVVSVAEHGRRLPFKTVQGLQYGLLCTDVIGMGVEGGMGQHNHLRARFEQ
ncbi:hypothetical protein D3C81_2186260 [compost metagenome]